MAPPILKMEMKMGEDMLDLAPGLEPQSRLACQCVPNGSQSIIVEIPEWNRNLVSEDH